MYCSSFLGVAQAMIFKVLQRSSVLFSVAAEVAMSSAVALSF